MSVLGLFLGFHGRIGRAAYWAGGLAVGLVGTALLLLAAFNPFGAAPPGVMRAIEFALWLPMLPLTAKRYHDLGLSAWWMALPVVSVVFAVVAITALVGGDGGIDRSMLDTSMVLLAAALGIVLWSCWHVFKLGCSAGEAGPNAFGPPARLLQDLFGAHEAKAGAGPVAAAGIVDVPAARGQVDSLVAASPVVSASPVARVAPRVSRGGAVGIGGRPASFGRRGA